MELKTLQQHWHRFGQLDPFGSILTDPENKGNKWDIDEFFRTGGKLIGELMSELHGLGLQPKGRCLDFGCGVGRLTQPLGAYFESCDGLDIAPSMIELARKYNGHGDRCRYHLSDAPDLRMFPDGSFSLVLSFIVLQHIASPYSRSYIAEFLRVLKPGGIAVFQVPGRYLQPEPRPTLPDCAYRARITLPTKLLMVRPRQHVELKVRVCNDSEVVWPRYLLDGNDFARLRIGNHWRRLRGAMLQLDDGRTHLPELPPQHETVVPLIVTAPARAGLYKLEVDIVEEGITWFAQRGVATPHMLVICRSASRPVFARHRASNLEVPDTDFPPMMEMHCIPLEEVLKIVAANGGRMIRYTREESRDLYESYRYIIIRV